MQIQIWDPVAQETYSKASLDERSMGGSEGSVVRIANALDALGHETRITFAPEDWGDVRIVLRDPNALAHCDGPTVLWMTDYVSVSDVAPRHIDLIRKKNVNVVALSDFHKDNIKARFECECTRIYLPCVASEKRPKKNRAIILSSPIKGLAHALQVFMRISKAAKLAIFNPGYEDSPLINTTRVTTFGPRLHSEVMSELASCKLLINANRDFPETFGLVYAEAKALGVPVLTYDHGSAKEVLGDFGSCMPLDSTYEDMAKEGDRLMSLDFDPQPDPRFALATIAREWETLLTGLVK